MNDAAAWSQPRRLRVAVGVLWIVALYLLCRPYRGVRHDAVLYFGQALFRDASWLKGDLFFLSNSQDQYSLFSTLFSPVLRALGLSGAEIVVLLALHMLMLFATWRLTTGWPALTRWSALVLATVLPHFYGASHRFAYAEPFLTARTLAEPFAVLGMAFALRGRTVAAGLSIAVAVVSHPLMALPAGLVAWRLLCDEDRRWNWAVLLIVPVLALALLNVGPFGALAHRYDPAWLDIVRHANEDVYVSLWRLPDWQQAAFDAALLWLVGRGEATPFSRLARATLGVMIACLLVSFVGADLANNILLTQLQLWRGTWVAHLVAMLSLAPLATRLWAGNEKGRLAVLLLLLAAITLGSTARTAWIIGLGAFAAVAIANSRVEIRRSLLRLGSIACVVAAIGISGVEASSFHDQILMGADSGITVGRMSAIPAALPALMLVLALVGLWPWLRPGRRALFTAASVGLVALVFGAVQWDQRTAWSGYVERHQGQPHPFQALIPPNAQVYWPDDLLASWGLLGRKSYFTEAQSAGALFSRESGVAAMARLKIVSPLVIQTRVCNSLVASGQTKLTLDECRPTERAAADVCHLTPVGPDFIVLTSPLKVPPAATWRFQPEDETPATDYLLYDCNRLH